MTQTIHMCLSIRGALRWTDRQLKGLITDNAGHRLTGSEVREYLMDRLSEGKKVLPCSDDCEGFSYETGCPGHEVSA